MKETGKVDFIVDDGSHQPAHQVVTALTLMPFLEKDGIYVIEDVINSKELAEYFINADYDVEIRDFRVKRFHGNDQMVIIRHKKDAELSL